MIGHPPDELFEEVAYIAYHLHWPYHELMSLDHRERRQWADEVARINTRVNELAGDER